MTSKRRVVTAGKKVGTLAIRLIKESMITVANGEVAKRLTDAAAHRGFRLVTLEMQPTDTAVHHEYMCHKSGQNIEEGHIQKGDNIRLITVDATFDPRRRQGAAFSKPISERSENLLLDCSAVHVAFDDRR